MPQIVATCSGSIAACLVAPHIVCRCDFIGRNQLALHKLIDLLHVAGVNIAVVAAAVAVAVAAVAVLINKSAAAAATVA